MTTVSHRRLVGFVMASLVLVGACADFDRFSVVKRDSGTDASTDASAAEGGTNDMDAQVDDGSVDDAGATDGGGCTLHTDCGDLEFCSSTGTCEPQKPNAQDCAAAAECISDFCDPDGICCTPGEDCCDTDSECAGQYRCDTGARECFASCTVGTEGSACKASGHCSVAGNCVADLAASAGNACSRDAMCVGNANCLDGYCCDGACGTCRACNLAGSLGTCTLVTSGTDPNNECVASGCTNDGTCNGAGACRVVQSGTDPNNACTASGCANDGMCNGSGACRVVSSGTDPNGACSGSTASCNDGTCDGSGACTPRANGSTCGAGDQCGSLRCSSGSCVTNCDYLGAPACSYCSGDAVYACGGCSGL